MSTAWFISQYKLKTMGKHLIRYCAVDDFTQQVTADGGWWTESEVLGNHAIVKVRASNSVLDSIAAAAGIMKLPVAHLDDSLSSLTTNQKTALRDKVIALGYTVDEIRSHLGDDLGSKTLGDVLRFVARRRLKPRFDVDLGEIVLDGIEQTCRPISEVDLEVTD